ncbi:MAG TPA: hypothetical protein VGI10_23720 [Polyangiaceae bacterium]
MTREQSTCDWRVDANCPKRFALRKVHEIVSPFGTHDRLYMLATDNEGYSKEANTCDAGTRTLSR